jgi:hypothetical protein
MGAARSAWNEAEHPRGSGGKFARKVVDVSETHNTGVRGRAAFHPRTPAEQRRRNKEEAPQSWRAIKPIYDKRDRGEPLARHEQAKIMWASPSKIAEQRKQTGDAYVPRDIASARLRRFAGHWSRPGQARTGIKKTFTGRPVVERGNHRDLLIPTPERPGSFNVHTESRVRRAFDWRPRREPSKPSAPVVSTPKPAYQFAVMDDKSIRALAQSLGIDVPKRAGRNQIIRLIQGA